MRLIAKKPCSFGGRKFFIGDEIPEGLVADAGTQEKYGVISIVNEDAGGGASGGQPGAIFTQEEADAMVAQAVEEAVKNVTAELEDADGFASFDGKVIIAVKGEPDGEDGRETAVPATPEEIQEAFSIMQMNAEEGARAVAGVTQENVLILLHAADSRKAIKAAAKKQADTLFPNDGEDGTGSPADSTDAPGSTEEDEA